MPKVHPPKNPRSAHGATAFLPSPEVCHIRSVRHILFTSPILHRYGLRFACEVTNTGRRQECRRTRSTLSVLGGGNALFWCDGVPALVVAACACQGDGRKAVAPEARLAFWEVEMPSFGAMAFPPSSSRRVPVRATAGMPSHPKHALHFATI